MNIAHKPLRKERTRTGAISRSPLHTLEEMRKLYAKGYVDLIPVRRALPGQKTDELFVTRDKFKRSARNKPNMVAVLTEQGSRKVLGYVYEGRRRTPPGVKSGEIRGRNTPEVEYRKGARKIPLSNFADPKLVRSCKLGTGVRLEDAFDGIIGTEAPLAGKGAPKLLLTVTSKNNEKRYFYENRRAEE